MNIVILNQHGANYGDDAAGCAALLQIQQRFPQCKVTIVYNCPSDVELLPIYVGNWVTHEHNKIAKSDLLAIILCVIGLSWLGRSFASVGLARLLSILSAADCVVVSPCGANIGIYKDWRFLIRVIAAIVAKKRPIFHLNTIGPSGTFGFDLLARYALRRSVLFVRERQSYDYLNKLGIHAALGVDSAFSLPDPAKLKKRSEIVLIVTDLTKWFKAFSDFDMARFIKELADILGSVAKERDLAIRIVPHLHSFMDERPFLETVASQLGRAQGSDGLVIVDDTYDSYEGYERRIAEAHAVVSMRYHGAVLAAKNGVVFIPISYENKMLEVANYCGCMDAYVDIGTWNPQEFGRKLSMILDENVARTELLRSKLPILRRLSMIVDDYIWLMNRRGA
jgi:polysaccharide pyruvyl transferase WcaK-like protein